MALSSKFILKTYAECEIPNDKNSIVIHFLCQIGRHFVDVIMNMSILI